MKKLKVPFIQGLDDLDMSTVSLMMETKAQREYIDVVDWKEFPYKPIVAFDIIRSEKSLYIRYFVKGFSLKAVFDKDDSDVHLDSCVEFFMQRCGDEEYMNFEFNCIGACDAARRISRDQKTSLTAAEYKSIRRYSSLEENTFEEKKGIYEWELLVSIQFEVMGLNPTHLPEKIKGNFYKCADDTEYPHFVSWNPIDLPHPNFHCPKFFGDIYF